VDLLQTKEMLKNAVHRSPMVSLLSFDELIKNEDRTAAVEEGDSGEIEEKPVITLPLQGPDLPPTTIGSNTLLGSQTDEDFVVIQARSVDSESRSLAASLECSSHVRNTVDDEDDAKVIATSSSFSQMNIAVISDDEEENGVGNKADSPAKSSTTSSNLKSTDISSTEKKKVKKSTAKKNEVSLPKSSYELEKFLLQHTGSDKTMISTRTKVSVLFTHMKRKDLVQLFTSCFEPNALYLFFLAVFKYYWKHMEDDVDVSTEVSQSQEADLLAMSNYFSDVSSLSNFSMLYSLLLQEEKDKVSQILNIIQEASVNIRNTKLIAIWNDISSRFK
jgi:hypothetical protein